jgi:hypothetical protein
MSDDLVLSGIPATDSAPTVEAWAASQAELLPSLGLDTDSFTARAFATTGMDAADRNRLINAALLADWACYATAADRADYRRLRAVMLAFPPGFRLFFCRALAGSFVPVAYTGWYPLTPAAFAKAYDQPGTLTHRGELWPQPVLTPAGDYIWLFNYCILPALRHSAQSRQMLQAYAADLQAIRYRGLAAAVLSDASKRVVARFGMVHTGDMTHDGVTENVYAVRLA